MTPTSFEDDDDTESESLSESSSTLERVTLEEAVKANPAFALARLASRLGLDYHNIHQSMGIYEQIRTVKAELEYQRTKREQSKDDDKNDDARSSKKTAIAAAILNPRQCRGAIFAARAPPTAFRADCRCGEHPRADGSTAGCLERRGRRTQPTCTTPT